MTETKRSFNYDDIFPDRWLHAEDLQGREVTLQITAAYQEDLRLPGGSVDTCGILSFAKTQREYVLNKTNAMVLMDLWGKDSAAWAGHRITLAAVPDTSGKSASGLRILIVGSPDLDRPTKVRQPQGKTRTIKATGNGSAPEVDVLTGEVIEQAASPATLPQDAPETSQATTEPNVASDDEYGDSGEDAAFWPTGEEPPGMDAESFKASRPRSAAEAGQRAAETAAKARAERPITAKQVNLVHAQCAIHGVDEHADLIPWLGDNLGVASVEAIPAARLDEALAWIKSHEKGAS